MNDPITVAFDLDQARWTTPTTETSDGLTRSRSTLNLSAHRCGVTITAVTYQRHRLPAGWSSGELEKPGRMRLTPDQARQVAVALVAYAAGYGYRHDADGHHLIYLDSGRDVGAFATVDQVAAHCEGRPCAD